MVVRGLLGASENATDLGSDINLHAVTTIMKNMVNLVSTYYSNKNLVDCIEEEATNLAIAANFVAKGITDMVTVDVEDC